MNPRIIVEISGGVCVAVYADQPVSVDVLDHDDIEGLNPDDPNDAEALADHRKLEAEGMKLKAYY